MDRVELYHGDASKLPFINKTFDAVFMSFTASCISATPWLPQKREEGSRPREPLSPK